MDHRYLGAGIGGNDINMGAPLPGLDVKRRQNWVLGQFQFFKFDILPATLTPSPRS